jgi:RNA polymerase sigma-70 factor (ECF subfamily)
MAQDDTHLLDAARAGDRVALERLLERHQGQVFRFGLKMCGSEDDAKDVLQETLIAAARTLRDFRGGSSLSTWLYSIARSFCIKQRRTGKHAPQHVSSLDDAATEAQAVADTRRGPDEQAAAAQVQATLRAAIAALDPKYREVLVLRDVEGLPAAQVGEILGLSVEAVKSRLHRARIAVRERVAPALGVADQPPPAPAEGACPDVVELFSKHVEGDISGAICSALEVHLQGCERCRARCDSLRATLTLCAAAGDEVPLRVERSVRAALRRWLDTHA